MLESNKLSKEIMEKFNCMTVEEQNKLLANCGLNKIEDEKIILNKINELYNNLDKESQHNFRNNVLTYFAYQINEFENCVDFKNYYFKVLCYSIPNIKFAKLINLHDSKTKVDFVCMILNELEKLNLTSNNLNNRKVKIKKGQ